MLWLIHSKKLFLIIGNQNAITYREFFPLVKNDLCWLGVTGFGSDMVFGVPKGVEIDIKDKQKAEKLGYVGNYTRLGNSCWFTNIDHGRRHTPLSLMTMKDNIRYGKHRELKENGYRKYSNYDALDVPAIDAIPSDYDGVMGVPLTFLDKYCPEQFEIIWRTGDIDWAEKECTFFTPPTAADAERYKKQDRTWRVQNPYFIGQNGAPETCYFRILIRKKQ